MENKNLIKCRDGLVRTQEEYDEWLDNLIELLQYEEGDLTENERQTLMDEGYIDDDDDDPYTDEAKDVYERIQYELSDDERMYYWTSYCNITDTKNLELDDFWDWFEGLNSDEICDFNDFINKTQPII